MHRSVLSTFSFLLAISIVLFSSSCSRSGKFDLVKAAKLVGAEEVGIIGFTKKMSFSNREDPVYVNDTGVDAQELFDATINRFGKLPEAKISEATAMYYPLSGEEDENWYYILAYSITFETKKGAQDFYQYYEEEITDKYDEGGNEILDSGMDSKGYKFTIGGVEKDNGRAVVWSVFMCGNQSLFVFVVSEDKSEPKPLRIIFDAMGIKSSFSIF